jgi:Terminase RNaseH-like domain/Terminase large subunit, T4likevirus-type, N-terminal
MTPLKGMTKVVQKFMSGESEGQVLIQMTLDDAEHYSPEQRAALIASYPAYIREARAYGRLSKGSGVVYPVTDEQVACDPLPIPSFWRQIGGLDVGGSGEEGHPTAAVKMAHDPEADIVYITATYRKKGGPIYEHAAALREWGADLPWAWPADALQHERKSGEQIKEMFLGHGLNMLSEFAQFEDGSTGLETSVEKIYERMLTGRWKVFRHLNDYFNEFGMYHRKDGVIVKENDDIMDASRYAHMMLRFAESMRQNWTKEELNVQEEWV